MRVQLLSAAGSHLIGFAKKKVRELEAWRAATNLPIAQKTLFVGGFSVYLRATPLELLIRIEGGGVGQILLSTPGGETVTTVYDYLKDATDSGYVFGEMISSTLNMFADGACHLGDTHFARFDGSAWTGGTLLPQTTYQHVVTDPDSEVEFLHDGSNIYGRTADWFGLMAYGGGTDVLLPQFCSRHHSLLAVTHRPILAAWNLYGGVSMSTLSPLTAAVEEAWEWVPSFFVVEPGDGFGLKPGWYYGRYPHPDYDQDNPLDGLAVSFLGLVETRDPLTPKKVGWVEVITEVNGVPSGDINVFFLGDMQATGNPYAYREMGTVLIVSNTITIGSAIQGTDKAFSVQTTVPGVKPDSVKAWNFSRWTDQDSLMLADQSALGLLVVEGKRLRGYRFTGYALQFVETDNFHSYTISHDGKMVAVFESTDGSLISSVKVFDLHGERDQLEEEPATYGKGGYTLIRDSATVEGLAAITGCFIPIRAEGFTPDSPLFIGAGLVGGNYTTTKRDYMSSLSTLIFPRNGRGGLTIRKVVCDNGVDARFGVSVDECFQSRVVVADPRLATPSDKLVSSWDVGGIFRGHVRGGFVGTHPNMRFYGVGDHAGLYGGGDEGAVTLPSEFSIYQYDDGTLSFEGHVGSLIIGKCIAKNENGTEIINPACARDLQCTGGAYQITASSSCGQTATTEKEVPPPSPLSVVWIAKNVVSNTIQAGDFFVGSGGIPPYRYNISCGSIDDKTGEVLSISGCCGTITITAADSCGVAATIKVRAPSGTWVLSHEIPGPCGDTFTSRRCGDLYGCSKVSTTWDGTDGGTYMDEYVSSTNCSLGCSTGGCTVYCCGVYDNNVDCRNCNPYPGFPHECSPTTGCKNYSTTVTWSVGFRVYKWECP
jgi:hypothetical protein